MLGQHFDGVRKACQRLNGWIPWLGINFREIVSSDGRRIALEPACGFGNLIGVCARRQYQRQKRIRIERDGSQKILKIRDRIHVGGLIGWRWRRSGGPGGARRRLRRIRCRRCLREERIDRRRPSKHRDAGEPHPVLHRESDVRLQRYDHAALLYSPVVPYPSFADWRTGQGTLD